MSDDIKPYHHGDLRAVLLRAAEAELAERGIEAFSLRSVAKRAGVSHAAPAHHFGDTGGLLTALAAQGYQLFLDAQAAREAIAAPNPQAQLVAAGLGYVDFAVERPALFRLLFGSTRPDYFNADLMQVSVAAYKHLVDIVHAAGGRSVAEETVVWAMAHGLADLLSSGRLRTVDNFSPQERDALIESAMMRTAPQVPNS